MKFLRDPRRDVAPQRALDTATQIAMRLAEPILAKIEPYDLGAFALDSTLALEYCKRVGNPRNQAKRTQRLVNYRALVEMYPAHEFQIDLEEARELGFVVSEPPDELDRLFDEVRPHLAKVGKYLGLVPE
jgi:hypothetical protein